MTRDPDPSRLLRDLPAPLTFGVFPLGVAGAPYGTASGAPDDYEAIGRALEDLRGGGPPLLPRMYVGWSGPQSTSAVCDQVQQLTRSGVAWDLALCYRDRAGAIEAWEAFVARIAREHGVRLAAIQVTGEANLTGVPAAADGDFPRAPEALVRGVLAGAQAKRQSAATAAIGFTVAPEVDPAASGFWAQVSKLGAGALARRPRLRGNRHVPRRLRAAVRATAAPGRGGVSAALLPRARAADRRDRRLGPDPHLRERLAYGPRTP